MNEIEEKRKELLLLEIQLKKDEYAGQVKKTTDYCKTLVNRCFKKEMNSKKFLLIRFLDIKHKTSTMETGKLHSITMTLDKRVMIQRPKKSFNKPSTVYDYFQDNPYGDTSEQTFNIIFNKETGEIDMKLSIDSFMLFTSEISTEMYEDVVRIADENNKQAQSFIEKYKL